MERFTRFCRQSEERPTDRRGGESEGGRAGGVARRAACCVYDALAPLFRWEALRPFDEPECDFLLRDLAPPDERWDDPELLPYATGATASRAAVIRAAI
jgi:hypothetical protein